MTRRSRLFTLLLFAGCGDTPTDVQRIAHVSISAPADSIQYGDAITLSAMLRDAEGRLVPNASAAWRSLHTATATIDESGRVLGLRPGNATIVAEASGRADTLRMRVVTSACSQVQVVGMQQSGFWGTYIQSGSTRYAESPSGITEYHGTPLFWGSGLIYGTHPDTMLVGHNHTGGINDFRTGVCLVGGDAMHTVSLLSLTTLGARPPMHNVDGLVVVQDQWAFSDPANDDYIIFRYTFTNAGSREITGLRIGFVADYDVHDAAANVASYTQAGAVASVTAADSSGRPVTGGMVLLGSAPASYRAPRLSGSLASRADHFELLSPGQFDGSPSDVSDVRQLLVVAPVALAAGEARTVGYALVAGESRAAFDANVAAARAKAASLWE